MLTKCIFALKRNCDAKEYISKYWMAIFKSDHANQTGDLRGKCANRIPF